MTKKLSQSPTIPEFDDLEHEVAAVITCEERKEKGDQ